METDTHQEILTLWYIYSLGRQESRNRRPLIELNDWKYAEKSTND